jgi:hypothetical protein
VEKIVTELSLKAFFEPLKLSKEEVNADEFFNALKGKQMKNIKGINRGEFGGDVT